MEKKFSRSKNIDIFASTVPVLHPVRSARGSFFCRYGNYEKRF